MSKLLLFFLYSLKLIGMNPGKPYSCLPQNQSYLTGQSNPDYNQGEYDYHYAQCVLIRNEFLTSEKDFEKVARLIRTYLSSVGTKEALILLEDLKKRKYIIDNPISQSSLQQEISQWKKTINKK